jgi:dienelactone hydrolase
MIDEALLRHLYRYDHSLPLLATSERDVARDPQTALPIDGLVAERVTFGSTHDERVLATVTRPTEGGPFPAVIIQHGSTPMGRHTWSVPGRTPLHQLWAQRGLLTIAVDAYGFGSREGADNRGRLGTDRADLMFRTRDARIQAVQDLMRTVDYLQTRPDVRAGAIGYAGVSMGCRVGVPFVALDARVGAAAFFVGGSGPYASWNIEGTEYADLAADSEWIFALTDPLVFAPMTAGRPMFMANGEEDVLVGREAGEKLQAALGEPKTLRWFDGGHGETPRAMFDEAAGFLAEQLNRSITSPLMATTETR